MSTSLTTGSVDSKDLSLNESSISTPSIIDISSVTVTNLSPDIIDIINLDTENMSNISQNQNLTTATVHPLSIDPKQLAHLVIDSSTLSNSQKSAIVRVILCGGNINGEKNQISQVLSSLMANHINEEQNSETIVDKKINFDLPQSPVSNSNTSPVTLASAAIDQLKTSNDCLEPLLRIMIHKQQQQKVNTVVNLIWNKLVTKMSLTASEKPPSTVCSLAGNGNATSNMHYNNSSSAIPTANSIVSHGGLLLPKLPIKMRPKMSHNSILNTYESFVTDDSMMIDTKKKFEILKPFLCSHPGCWRRFKHQTNLRIHSVIHGPQALQCRFCSKKFARKSNLSQHLRVHTGERPFVCTLCNRGFKQLHSMKAHLQIHNRESCHVCSLCMNYFQSSNDLRKHQRLVHTVIKNSTAVNIIDGNRVHVSMDEVNDSVIIDGQILL